METKRDLSHNDINKKLYIGKTSRNLEIRFAQHCSKTAHREDNSILHKAMEKYGMQNFHIEEIELISLDTKQALETELNEKEKKYIHFFNSLSPYGYNILIGGETTPKNRIHPIFQFDIKGNFIKSFDSISDALINVGEQNLKSFKIQYHLKTDCFAYGYLWSDNINNNPYVIYT